MVSPYPPVGIRGELTVVVPPFYFDVRKHTEILPYSSRPPLLFDHVPPNASSFVDSADPLGAYDVHCRVHTHGRHDLRGESLQRRVLRASRASTFVFWGDPSAPGKRFFIERPITAIGYVFPASSVTACARHTSPRTCQRSSRTPCKHGVRFTRGQPTVSSYSIRVSSLKSRDLSARGRK